MPTRMPSRMARSTGVIRVFSVLITALSLGLLTVLGGASHAAAQAYLYWGYYQWTDGEWALAATGAGQATPADGDVAGWRFAAAGEDTPPRLPRADGDFDLICGSTPAAEMAADEKRVAVVIDYGTDAEAPDAEQPANARGACAVVEEDATGLEILASVADLRQDGELVCGVDGYPAQGCGDPTEVEPDPDPEPQVELELSDGDAADGGETEQPDTAENPNEPAAGENEPVEREGPGALSVLLIALGALVVLVVLGGILQVRRNAARRDH